MFPNNLRALREDRGWSQQEVADRVGWHVTTIGKLERGDRELKASQISALSRALQCRPFEILSGEDPLGKREAALLALFQHLSEQDKDRLLRLGNALAEPEEPNGGNEKTSAGPSAA